MKRTIWFNVLILILVITASFSCRTADRHQTEYTKAQIEDAYKKNIPVLISLKGDKVPKVYNVVSAIHVVANTVSIKDTATKTVKTILINKITHISPSAKDYKGSFPFEHSAGKIIIVATLKSINDGFYTIDSKDKYSVTLIDNSKMQGKVAGIDYKKNEIVLVTKIKNYTLPGDSIVEMERFKIDAKVVLIDGSSRVGELIKDEGNEIMIKSILGEESFNRKDVLKIEYQK